MDTTESIVPYGDCQCGCGEKTRLAPQSSSRYGWTVGEPLRYVHGHHRRKSGVPFRTEDRGYKTPCHIWLRATSSRGYGTLAVGERTVPAHAYYYEKLNGPVPSGLELDHLCRVRLCVNPDHLEAVTRAENVRRGALTKLTIDEVRQIRKAPRVRGSGRALAQQFGVSDTTIGEVRSGHTWANT